MNIPNWFYDERVQKIAPEKLTLLLRLAEQLEGKTSQKEIMPGRHGRHHFCQPQKSDVFQRRI